MKEAFILSDFFPDVTETTRLNIIEVKERLIRDDGKNVELDVVAQSKTGISIVEDFQEKVKIYSQHFPKQKILPTFLSLGGFTEQALLFCQSHAIGTAERILQY